MFADCLTNKKAADAIDKDNIIIRNVSLFYVGKVNGICVRGCGGGGVCVRGCGGGCGCGCGCGGGCGN